MQKYYTLILFIALSYLGGIPTALGQSLPLEMNITSDGHLITGDNEVEGLYNLDNVYKMELTFNESNWFTLLDGSGGGPGGGGPGGGTPGISLIATLTFNDDEVLDSVLVSIKGATSDFMNNSEKKSFSIDLDVYKNHDLMGYDNLNFNCGFQDPSSMREVLYNDVSKAFSPALKSTFIDLYINGEYWGPYSNVQQIEGTYISEWWTDNDGTRWRALDPDWTAGGGGPGGGGGGPGGGGGGGGMFGQGRSTLNYNGPDSTDYNGDYTLKNTDVDDPWAALINACEQLNNLPVAELYDELKYHIDVDHALWFLAREIIFMDDDSYVYKGGMDYYVYWNKATDRVIPLEVDGNTVMPADEFSWSLFRNTDNTDFPLLNRLMLNNEIRQRYLAHVRTILEEHFIPSEMHNRIDVFFEKLDQRVADDPKKIFSYSQFTTGVDELKSFISNRHNFLSNLDSVDRPYLGIQDLSFSSTNGMMAGPNVGETVEVQVNIEDDASIGVHEIRLHYGGGFEGAFEYTLMTDEDGDGTYEGTIPSFPASSYVRFYVEAIANDENNTASFYPKGAEHDVFIYQVEAAEELSSDIVINELMASNDATMSDEMGEYDDWIELYNNTNATIDLTGYSISDDENNITKWRFPEGTTLSPDRYLMLWADDDEEQGPLHTNFKLNAGGETILLSNAEGIVINRVQYEEQETDLSYARIPNGLGDFVIKAPTFGFNNELETATIDTKALTHVQVFPNPSNGIIWLEYSEGEKFELINLQGQLLQSGVLNPAFNHSDYQVAKLDLSNATKGIYIIKIIGANKVGTAKVVIE